MGLHENIFWIRTAIKRITIWTSSSSAGKHTQVVPGKQWKELVGVCEIDAVAKLQEYRAQFSGLAGENASAVVAERYRFALHLCLVQIFSSNSSILCTVQQQLTQLYTYSMFGHCHRGWDIKRWTLLHEIWCLYWDLGRFPVGHLLST